MRKRSWPLLLFGVILAMAPIIFRGEYFLSILISYCINLILLTGLNIILGYAGQISMAQAGFYGLGAYTAGILTAKLGWSPLLGFVLAPVVVALVALVVGIPSLRLRGMYFGMATLGVCMVLYLAFERSISWTGGPNGLLGIPVFSVYGYKFSSFIDLYWIAAGLAFLGLLGISNLQMSHVGRALRALSVSENGAAAVGVDAFRLKLVAFILSGVFAGCAGAVQTFQAQFVSPETFGFFTTVLLIVGLVLGGSGTLWGPAIGSGLLVALDEIFAGYPDYKPLILGAVFLIVILFFPKGLVGGIETFLEFLNKFRNGGMLSSSGGGKKT